MVARGSDSTKDPGPHGRLPSGERLAMTLDGVRSTADRRTARAYRLALHVDQEVCQHTLAQLQRWSPRAIAVASSNLASTRRVFQTLRIPHVAVDCLRDVPAEASVVVLGCQDPAAVPVDALRLVLSREVTVITSDKSALLEPLRDVLQPGASQPARMARVRWTTDASAYSGQHGDASMPPLLSGLHLPAGYVPVAAQPQPDSSLEVLVTDELTGQPMLVRAYLRNGRLLHSVAHWWQQPSARGTVLDRRPVASIPAFAAFGDVADDVTFGELQAARTMTRALLCGLRPLLR